MARRRTARVAGLGTAVVLVAGGAAGCGGPKNYKDAVTIQQLVATDQVDIVVTGQFANPENNGVSAQVTLDLKIKAGGTCTGGSDGSIDTSGPQGSLDYVAAGATVMFQMRCSGYLPPEPDPSLAQVVKVTLKAA
jgi:hypothetical protein